MEQSESTQKTSVQSTLECYSSGKGIEHTKVSQKSLDKLLLEFVISETQPLSIVDKPAFVNLVKLGLPNELKVMCRKTMKLRIDNAYSTMVDNLIAKLSNVEHVATTADCWTKGKRSYLGVTCHWIDKKSFSRESVSLACTRLKGRHTYDVLANALYKIHAMYKIQNKIVASTTDSGSNFVKAFKSYQKSNDTDDESDEDEDCNDDEVIDLFEILSNCPEEDTDMYIQLPPHYRCASHTLDLIAKCDIDKMIRSADTSFKNCYRKALAKCSSLWTKQNMSTLAAENIHNLLNVYLKTPNKTRWNATYDGLLQIKNILSSLNGMEKINQAMDFCEIQRFTTQEIKLIEEYCEVMAPLAESLDFLQGEDGMLMGYLLPTLYALEKKMTILEQKNLQFCSPLVKTIKNSLKKRFSSVWNKKELIIASCLIPRFKLVWLEGCIGCNYFTAEAWLKTLFESVDESNNSENSESDYASEDFFCLPVAKKKSKKSSCMEEIELYLKSNCQDLSLLHTHPAVLKIFLEYNTPIPSSAPVERLFSTGSNVMTVKRNKLSDSLFEKLVLLKQNKMSV